MTEAQALGALVALVVTLLVMLYELWRISLRPSSAEHARPRETIR
jgi:hypothetical protein